jgi:predicted 3-demethylubiquinone-9 3-methyltransferase (glyoxalase superfamily)
MSNEGVEIRLLCDMQKISPFLWFDHQAEEAVNLYTSIFKDSSIDSVSRYPEGAPGVAGQVMVMTFTLFGQKFTALNGGPHFQFTEAVSFVVSCENQEEVDYYWDRLIEGGSAQQCGWLKDKYGLSWQVTPTALGELMSSGTPEQSGRVMGAMMQMVKFDVAGLQRAFDGV